MTSTDSTLHARLVRLLREHPIVFAIDTTNGWRWRWRCNKCSLWFDTNDEANEHLAALAVEQAQQCTEPYSYQCQKCEGTGRGTSIAGRCEDCKGMGTLIGRRVIAALGEVKR